MYSYAMGQEQSCAHDNMSVLMQLVRHNPAVRSCIQRVYLVKYGYKEKAECILCKKAHEEN